MKTLELASDVVAGSTTFAGLIIVYVGAVASSYTNNFSREARGAVAPQFRRRARNAGLGVISAALAASVAILGKWASSNAAVGVSVVLLIITLAWGVAVTVETVREIK